MDSFAHPSDAIYTVKTRRVAMLQSLGSLFIILFGCSNLRVSQSLNSIYVVFLELQKVNLALIHLYRRYLCRNFTDLFEDYEIFSSLFPLNR